MSVHGKYLRAPSSALGMKCANIRLTSEVKNAVIRGPNRPAPIQHALTHLQRPARERQIALAALQRRNWNFYDDDGTAAQLRLKPATLTLMMKRLHLMRIG
jgi:transcriptional regulator with GAF, ATPase, and Fis domain